MARTPAVPRNWQPPQRMTPPSAAARRVREKDRWPALADGPDPAGTHPTIGAGGEDSAWAVNPEPDPGARDSIWPEINRRARAVWAACWWGKPACSANPGGREQAAGAGASQRQASACGAIARYWNACDEQSAEQSFGSLVIPKPCDHEASVEL